MKTKFNQNLLAAALMGMIAFGSGCATKNDAVAQAEKSEKNAPGIEETKAIAEEGFIYGLPIVMNYAVMYAFCVDTNSSQYKAPFNQIFNEHRIFTYKDTAIVTPNSDTPYSSLWLDLRAEPMVLSVPAVEKERYYSVMLCDGNTFNYGYIGSRATGNDAGDYLRGRARLERRDPGGHQESVPLHHAVFAWRPTARSFSTRRTWRT